MHYSMAKKPLNCIALFLSHNCQLYIKSFVSKLNTSIISNIIFNILTCEKWKKTMKKDIEALNNNDLWEWMRVSLEWKILGCKWVYIIKYQVNNFIERNKGLTNFWGIYTNICSWLPWKFHSDGKNEQSRYHYHLVLLTLVEIFINLTLKIFFYMGS